MSRTSKHILSVLFGDVEDIEANISVLFGNVETLTSNIDILHGNVETLTSNIVILHGNVETLESNIDILHGNVETLESNIDILHGNVETLTSNIDILHGNVETFTDDITSNVSRIAAIEGDYVTTNELVTATTATAAGAGFLTAGSVIFSSFNDATQTTTSKTLGDHFDELEDLYNANEAFNMETFVQKPTDWSGIPLGQATSNLKLYTEWKVDRLKEGRGYGTNDENSYLKVRDASVNFGGNRIGTQKLEFLRTTVSEAFGTDEAPDWRLTTDSLGNFNVYRKSTTPGIGVLYEGNVIEFKVDGDIKIKKPGGLFIDDEEVATIQEVTDQVAPVDQAASQLVTLTNGHSTRITDLEDAGYVTQTNLNSTLSTYALQSALGTTNTTVGNIDNRLVTVENAGYVTASGLTGYNFATQGYVQTAVADLATETYVDTAVAGVSGSGGVSSANPSFTGTLTTSGKINMGTYAVQNGYMASKRLTLGDTQLNYGDGSNWNANTAGLMLECADNTEMAVHDAATRIASLMYYEGVPNRITIGRNMGWGTIGTVNINGNVGVGTASPAGKLHVYDGSAQQSWRNFYVRPISLWGDGLTSPSETGGTKYMTTNMIMLQGPHITPYASGQNAYIRYGRAGGVQSGYWWETAFITDGSFRIRREANDAYGLSIIPNGYVGINEMSPEATLDA